ncbi:MAG: hypothetical protein ACR2HB_08070 [Dehalococcoidia bacterium]
MSWPTPQDYSEAIQNLALNCRDPVLQAGVVVTTPLGLPRPITGNFASVYRVHSAGTDWAVRCFWREFADQQDRYRAISRHLQTARLPYTVGFQYLPQGIRIRGSWYPLLKMEWVEGELLSTYVERCLGQPNEILALAERWRVMLGRLEASGVAHGDLQHGNILVVGGQLKLVDYDGMYVPALAGRGSHELGNQHYQHPRRDGTHFGPSLDRFSALVVYLSLVAVGRQPEVWRALGAGEERLLFRREDFVNPTGEVWRRLTAILDPRIQTGLPRLRAALVAGPRDLSPCKDELTASSVRRPRRSLSSLPAGAVRRELPVWPPDHLPPPLPPARFGGNRALPRLALAAVATIFASLALVAVLPPATLSFALLGFALIVAVAYAADPAVRARHPYRRRLGVARYRLRRQRFDLWWKRKQRNQAQHGCQRGGSRRDARLAALEQRRDRDRKRADEMLAQSKADINVALKSLKQAEHVAIQSQLEDARRRHVQRRLRQCSVRRAPLSQISPLLRMRLWIMGVRSAADLDATGLATARTLSPSVARILAEWRVDAELEARQSAPRSLLAAESAAIAQRFQRGLAVLLEDELLANARRGAVDAAIDQRYNHRAAQLDRRQAPGHRRRASHLAVLEGELSEAIRWEAEAAGEVTEAQQGLAPFASITVAGYLAYLIALR